MLSRRLLMVCLMMVVGLSAAGQTIFQDAMYLNQMRDNYDIYCAEVFGNSSKISDFYTALKAKGSKALPGGATNIRAEILAILKESDAATGDGNSSDDEDVTSIDGAEPPSGNTSTNTPNKPDAAPKAPVVDAQLETKIQHVAREWALIDQYLQKTKNQTALSSADVADLQDMADGFTYLDDISNRVVEQPDGSGKFTSGAFTSLLGINEADIIMGIVDWTLKQAKAELMKAFLGEWLERIESDSALQLLFPNTLNLLSTTDITTVFSDGAVWKAAFKQDLDAAPDKMPQLVALILRKIPSNLLNNNQKKEILGVVRIATGIYQNIGKGNTVDDAITNISNQSMMVPNASLSIIEKGVVLTDVFLEAISYVGTDRKLTFATPGTLSKLSDSELLDLWHLTYISLQPKLAKVFGEAEVQGYYETIVKSLPLLKQVLTQTADIIQTIKQLTDSGKGSITSGSKKLDFQEIDRYFQLSLDLVDNSLQLLTTLKVISTNDIAFYTQTARPIAVDVMNGIKGVSTQQYGLLITSILDIVERLSTKLNPSDAAVVAQATVLLTDAISLIDKLQKKAQDLPKSSNVQADYNALKQRLQAYDTANGAQLHANDITKDFAALLDSVVVELAKFTVGTTTTAIEVKQFLDKLLADLEAKADGLVNLTDNKLGQYINTYGRFVVDLLTADSSADVEALLNDVALGTGGYMVKQTSKSAFTVTFLPGIGGGAELLRVKNTNGDIVSNIGMYGGASLPIGLEYSLGIRNCKVLGAIGLYAQVADLGSLLNYRLTNTDTLPVTPEIGFQQVLSPGLSLLLHGTKVPIVFGLGVAYSPALRGIGPDDAPIYQAPAIRLGATLSVDVTVFQLWASKKKINANFQSLSQMPK